MLPRSNQHSLPVPSADMNAEGTKVLQRLYYYLANNQTWHQSHHSTAAGNSDHDLQQRRNANQNSGMALPIRAMIWFLQQYAAHHHQQPTGGDRPTNEPPQQRQHLLQQIQPLLPYCTKLRITSVSWPSNQNTNNDNTSINTTISPQTTTVSTTTISGCTEEASQVLLVLTKCISQVFPKLHTLWFDQIRSDDIIPLFLHDHDNHDNEWRTTVLFFSGGSATKHSANTNGLRVLRIDLLQNCNRIDRNDSDQNDHHPADDTPILSTTTPSTLSSAKKVRSKPAKVLLHRDDSNSAMILASILPPIHQDECNRTKSMSLLATTEKNHAATNQVNNDELIYRHRIVDFPHLRHFHCTSNDHQGRPGRVMMMHQTFPAVESLCISHGRIRTTQAAFAGLDRLPNLQHLDVSYNLLSSLSNVHYQLGRIVNLNLSHNLIQTVEGIDRLYSLQILRINHNRISDLHNTASRLANLPLLTQLYLEGNPCCFEPREQTSTTHVPDDTGQIAVLESTRNKVQKKQILYYHVNIWNAFIERRMATFYNSADQRQKLTIRDVQNELIPQIDGKLPSQRQWYILRNRVFTTIERPLIVKHSNHRDTNNVATPLDTCYSYSFQSNMSTTHRPSRHKHRAVVSVDDRSQVPDLDSGIGMQNDDPSDWHDYPNPTFSIFDVVDSLQQKPDVTCHQSNIPPSIICMHEAVLPSDIFPVSNDANEFLELDENIGQQYLDSIVIVPEKMSSSTIDEWNAASTPSSEHNLETVVNYGNQRQTAVSADQIETVFDDVNGLVLSKENDNEHQTNVSIDKTIPSFEAIDDMSLCRDSITDCLAALVPSIEKSHQSNPEDAFDSIVKNKTAAISLSATGSPESPQHKLTVLVPSFSESRWNDDNVSLPSGIDSNIASPAEKSTVSDRPSRHEMFRQAEVNSKYVGPKTYQHLLIRDNLELYFRLFVFSTIAQAPSSKAQSDEEEESWSVNIQGYPRIQLWPVDRKKQVESYKRREAQVGQFHLLERKYGEQYEVFHRVWREKVIGCGKSALQRLTPNRVARFGFHGELLWSNVDASQISPDATVECREAICCLSDVSFYIIVDHDTVTCKPKKESKKDFPLPILESAMFKDAKWPHALVCHSLEQLRAITIGFGFQRLILHFEDCNKLYVYVLLTCNKLETIALLKLFQDLTSTDADLLVSSPSNQIPGIQIDNDDPLVLDSLATAVSPDIVGVVLHYQVLQQKWKSGGRGTVRRVCVVTDSKVFLLDEDYTGNGSGTVDVDCTNGKNSLGTGTPRNELGRCRHRLVDSADLDQIEYVESDDADPKSVTIVMKPLTRLTRRRNWRLVCRDSRQGAERLVEDIRKAVSLL